MVWATELGSVMAGDVMEVFVCHRIFLLKVGSFGVGYPAVGGALPFLSRQDLEGAGLHTTSGSWSRRNMPWQPSQQNA
jgi:hypothetical protein